MDARGNGADRIIRRWADAGGAEMQAERNHDARQRRLALYDSMAGFTRA
jgi:hypothetical protein